MKKLLALGFFCLVSSQVNSQSTALKIESHVKTIGKNLLTNSDLQAKEYIFPERIYHFTIDQGSDLLSVQLRGTSNKGKWLNTTGDLIVYDLLNDKIRWKKRINYQVGDLEQHNDVIIQTKGNKSYSLDPLDGKEMWKAKNKICYVDPDQKIGMGYRFSSVNHPNNLEGIDLTNGNWIWNRYINREYGWNEVFHLNDSVVMVVAAGLHSINLYTGQGWDFDTVTGKKDYKEANIANAAGLVLGAFTGTFVLNTGYNMVSDVRSNVVVDSSNIYFASKTKITKLTQDGKIKWRKDLPEDLTSKSSIIIRDSNLYLVNSGYAFMGNRQVRIGKPFFASFDLNSGKQNFLSIIKEKKDRINGYIFQKDTVLFVLKDRVSKYLITDGSFITEKIFDNKLYGELTYFLGDQVFIKTDSIYKSVVTTDSTKNYLMTSTNRILVTNQKQDIIEEIDFKQLYLNNLSIRDYKFLSKGNETSVLDLNDREVARLNISGEAILVGTKLYDMQENRFIEVNLSSILKN